MSQDKRNILEVLKFELQFLEQGGYGRYVRTPWKPMSIFQDSLSCLNFNEPERPHPCSECFLTDMVPDNLKEEAVPCHHIALNEDGETIYTMERQRSQLETEEALRDWLHKTIARLEKERAEVANPASSGN